MAHIAAACSAAMYGARSVGAAFAGQGQSQEHRVEIHRFKYKPATLSVKAGDVITWENLDIAPHTATANDDSWDTGPLEKGDVGSVVVTEDMVVDYFCVFHPHMKARLKLQASTG